MRAALLAFLLCAEAAVAQVRPPMRPGDLAADIVAMTDRPRPVPDEPAVPASPRPPIRPDAALVAARDMRAQLSAPVSVVAVDGTLRRSDRPVIRPALSRPRREAALRGGGLCGRPSLAGEAIAPVRGQGACGIPDAVRVRAAGGIPLSRPARMDCTAALALDDWVTQGVIPIIGGRGGGVARLEVAAGYACRTRNSQAGARLSEHAKGRAIDISGIRLLNGEVLSVLQDWARGSDGRVLQRLWQAACGPFTTVLGPAADRFHRDHFHLDVASDRRRAYCR